MNWRIAEHVLRGEVDNRVQGRVTGELWLAGRKEPVRLELRGDCQPDVAGRLLSFSNPNARDGETDGIADVQHGTAGVMTASRKVRIGWTSDVEAGGGCRWSNCLYLEWYSEENGRVLIESVEFDATISEPAWEGAEESASADPGALPAETEVASGFEDDETREAIERVLRINDLKYEAEQLIGGEIVHTSAGPVPPDIQEKFWQEVVKFEKSPSVSRLKMLEMDGVVPRAPGSLNDDDLHAELWTVIHALAHRRTFLDCTDHLSDRELYQLLVERVLEEPTTLLDAGSDWSCHLSLHEYGTHGDEEGVELYLRFYADEETRRQWLEDYPGEMIPESEDPPYDRDRLLPGVGADEDGIELGGGFM